MKPILLTIVIALFVNLCWAQKKSTNKARNPNASVQRSIKIDKSQPSVYINFEKFGKRTPLREDESSDGIYLRIYNNLRYSIRFCAFGISDEAEQLSMYSNDGQMGLSYDIVLNAIARTEEQPKIDVPFGYPIGGICHYYELKPGKSLVFSVPKEHLIKSVSLKINFRYEWEEESEEKPEHFVFFNSYSVPK